MKEISTTQVYYAYFNNSNDAIKAYKVIDAVFDIGKMRYTLTLNVAGEGVKTIVVETWQFYLSPLDVLNDKQSFDLMNLSLYASCIYYQWISTDSIPCIKNFRNALKQNGFVLNNRNEIIYHFFSGGVFGEKEERLVSRDCFGNESPCLLIGTYNLLTNELKGVQFNPKAFWYITHCYKTKQECLNAQMPKVVEFEEQPQNDVEMLFNVNVSIKAKDATDAQRKLSLMLQMASKKF